jgi:hypothetical protein
MKKMFLSQQAFYSLQRKSKDTKAEDDAATKVNTSEVILRWNSSVGIGNIVV